MGKYVEQSLGKNETLVKKAQLNGLCLVPKWLFGILFFWLLFIPLIKAIIFTVQFYHIELAVTSRRMIGKIGVFNTKSLDSPLNKIQSASVTQKFWGKVFNYGDIVITTAASTLVFCGIKNAEEFKGIIMSQIDEFEETRMNEQASKMASAMAGVIKPQQ